MTFANLARDSSTLSQYFLNIAFRGTRYHGWQVQENAHTVQAELQQVLGQLFDEAFWPVIGCGRTDTGVHASDFYCSFQRENLPFDPGEIKERLNKLLPEDIAVHRVLPVGDKAHVRYDATARTYEYHLHQEKDPFRTDTSYYFQKRLDLEALNQVAAILSEYQHFSAFCRSGSSNVTDICHIQDAVWHRTERGIFFRITADRFLRNMVRALVGTMLPIGYGKYPVENIRTVIESGDRREAGTSAPAHGLFLTRVEYPYEWEA